jgi:prepilin-type N-terminal cleavage/methylation domain-containing protein
MFSAAKSARLEFGNKKGFTLIELMVAVSMMVLLFGIGIPAFVRAFSVQGINKLVQDTIEACSQARAQAIVTGATCQIVFRPQDKTFRVVPGVKTMPQDDETTGGGSMNFPAKSFTIPQDIDIEILGVNFKEMQDEEVARVKFYSNSTSDEFTIVYRSSDNQVRVISLELVTALPTVTTR